MSQIGSVAMGDDMSGTPDEARDRIDEWGDAGAGHPSIVPITGTEDRIAKTFAAHV